MVLPLLFLGWNFYLNGMGNGVALKMTQSIVKELYKSVPILWAP
jgi:hypothetical protein